jgi:hypothetical protein
MLYWVQGLVNTHEIHKRLLDVARDLMALSELPPNTSLVSSDVLRAVMRLYRSALRLHELDDTYFIPVFDDVFLELYETVHYLHRLVSELDVICDAIRRHKVVVSPNPCHVHTMDSVLEQVVKDFKAVYRRLPLVISEAVMASEGFLSELQSFSVFCSLVVETECLKHADPRGVAPASLRIYVSDFLSAVNRVAMRFAELYYDISEWKVGMVRLYESPATTQELLNVAEHMANVLHKQVETLLVPRWVATKVAVFSLEDRVTVRMQTFGDIVAKPRWVIDVYATHPAIDVLKRMLTEKGFKTETTFYGVRVTIPPGDIMEATRITCMLPSITIVAGEEEDQYRVALARLELLESKLKGQKPLKKRKRGV